DDPALLLDRPRVALSSAVGSAIEVLSDLPEESVDARPARGHARPDHLAVVVDLDRPAEATAERPDRSDLPAPPENRLPLAGLGDALADDRPALVDRRGVAVPVPAQGPKVGHLAVLPEKSVTWLPRLRHGGLEAVTDDLGPVVDGDRPAVGVHAAEGAQICHLAVLPEERVGSTRCGAARPRDLTVLVDREREAAAPSQRSGV